MARYLVALLWIVSARGQSYPLEGEVRDPSGAGVEGAHVVLKQGGGSSRQTLTDLTGAFRFPDVARGSYELTAERDGFRTYTSRIQVGSRAPAVVRIALAVADVRQEITISGEAAQVNTETADNLDTVTLNRESLDGLPIFDQDYIGTISRLLDFGSVGTGGVTLIVDGVEATRAGVSASAIQEVKINQNPYSAEFQRPGRGRIEIITKPGSQNYHGAVNFLFRDSGLNARDPFALTRPPEQRRIFEGSLTGPVGRSQKTSFLISADRQEEDLQAVVFAEGPSGPIRENVPAPRRDTELSGTINHQMGDNHLLSLRGIYADQTIRNQGVGGFTLPESGADFENREDQLIFNQRGLIGPKLLNQFRFMVGRQHTPTTSLQTGPRIVVLDAFTGGGAQANRLQTENHIAFNEVISWTRSKHVIRAGINVPDISRRGLTDYTNFDGTYSFSTLQDYVARRPFSLVRQQGDGHIVFVEKVIGGFVQDEFRVLPNFSVTAGLRYDWQNYFHDNNNISPRLAFAYAPGKGRKTVIRGGGGLFYDRTGPGPIFDLQRYDGLRLRRFVISDPEFPGAATGPTSVVRLDRGMTIPYLAQYGIGVERQVGSRTTVTVNYTGVRGVNLFRSRDINAPAPPFYTARPDASYSVVRQIESSADLQAHSLEVALRGAITRRFNGMIQYTLGRSYNNVGGGNPSGGNRTSGITAFPANNYDLSGEWARSDFDQRHRFNMLGTFNPGRSFKVGLALSMYSGAPYSLTTGRDDNRDGLANDRPAGVSRNSLEGPGFSNVDLRLSRDFYFAPAKRDKGPTATVAMDAFNLLNQVNYTAFVGNLRSPFFGKAVTAQPPRRLQVSVAFKF